MRRVGLLAMAATLLLCPDADAVERRGFLFGVGPGFGVITCDGCDSLSGVAVEFHAGNMIGHNLALMVDGSGVAKDERGGTLYSVVVAGALQYWAAPRVWLKAGVGAGQLELESRFVRVRSDQGLAFIGGVGVEVHQTRRFAIDLQFRASTANIEGDRVNNIFGVVGFNWY